MNARQIDYFIKAVEFGSLGKAARALSISQPALSKSLHQLEEEFQAKLVERSSYGIRPTAFGECLYEHAKRAEGEINRARHEIDVLRGAQRGSVSIGVIAVIARNILPHAVARLTRARPGISISVTERFNSLLFSAFYRGEFDFIVAAIETAQLEAGLTTRVLFYDELVVAVRPGHPLTRAAAVTAKHLAQHSWIYPKMGTPYRSRIDEYFRASRVTPPRGVIEGGSDVFVRELLTESDLVAILPEELLTEEKKSGRLAVIRLGSRQLRRPIGIVHRGWTKLSPASRALISEIEKYSRLQVT